MKIDLPTPAFENAGGGCEDPFCDYQVQCGACFEASERQYNEWFARAGYHRSMFQLVIAEMHEQVHAEGIEENRARALTTAKKLGRMAAQWERTAETADSVGDRSRGRGAVYRRYAALCRERIAELGQEARP